MLSPYRIQPNKSNKRKEKASKTNFDNNSHREHDVKRHRLTSPDLKTTQTKESFPESKKKDNVKHTSNRRNKNLLKAGSMQEDIEINDQYLDEILDNKII